MKKILLLIITLTLVFTLGACNTAPDVTDEYALQTDLELLEEKISDLEFEVQEIQEIIDNLGITRGLNNQVSIYENQVLKDELDLKLVTLSLEIMVIKDTFDKAKNAPDYIKDDLGDYVSFEDLGAMLQTKYFGENAITSYDVFEIGSKAYLQFELDGTYDTNELFAKMVLLIEEVRHYEFYVLSCNELEIYIMWDNKRMSITIPLVVIINSYFDITLNGVYDGDYEMNLWTYETSIVESAAQLLYDDYKTNLTYDGFVLNYTIK